MRACRACPQGREAAEASRSVSLVLRRAPRPHRLAYYYAYDYAHYYAIVMPLCPLLCLLLCHYAYDYAHYYAYDYAYEYAHYYAHYYAHCYAHYYAMLVHGRQQSPWHRQAGVCSQVDDLRKS